MQWEMKMARYEKQVKEVFKKCFHIQGEGGNNFFLIIHIMKSNTPSKIKLNGN